MSRNMKKEELTLLKSREVIAINQDPLGIAGDRVWKQGPYEVILPAVSPVPTETVSSSCPTQ